MALVAGIDSSTQSCKIVVRDAETGAPVRQGQAPHPPGTEISPHHWEEALFAAADDAGGLKDVQAIAVAAQQHGMICLDEDGAVIRPALLWNDTRSAGAATELIDELGGPETGAARWAHAVGSVPVASFTVTKLRWLAIHEPANAARTAAVCLPHDWLTWRLLGSRSLDDLATDRGDASGTGYWSPRTATYRPDILSRALGHVPLVPRVLEPAESPGIAKQGSILGPGTGDNAGAALGLGAGPGDLILSIGTSGVVTAVTQEAFEDASGTISGFTDATGHFLPLVCTMNATRVLDATATMLGVDHRELARLALSAPSGADGLVMVPYLEGERTPNRPNATGAMHGLRLANANAPALARAAVEGVLCGLADGLDALLSAGVTVERIYLVGGGARSVAVQQIAPAILGRPVLLPGPGEYVADGAAKQAAWTLSGTTMPPNWSHHRTKVLEALAAPHVRERYREARDLTIAQKPELTGT